MMQTRTKQLTPIAGAFIFSRQNYRIVLMLSLETLIIPRGFKLLDIINDLRLPY